MTWTADDMWSRHTVLTTARVRLGVLADRVRTAALMPEWEGAAAQAARSALGNAAGDLDDLEARLAAVGDVLSRAGDDRAALERWDPAIRTTAVAELDRAVADELAGVHRPDETRSDRHERTGWVEAVDRANRTRMADERRTLLAVARDLARQVDEALLGGLFTDADAGLEQTRARLAAIDALETVLERPGRNLIHFEPGERRVTAAVSIGDVGGADRVAVLLPGAGTTIENSLGRHDAEMAALVADAGAISPASTAAVSWLGYEAPQWNTELIDPQRSVASTGPAAEGAPALVRTLEALQSSRHGDRPPAVTLIAHSYGTVVASETLASGALTDGGRPEAVVLMGSPGWAAPDTTTPVYVAEARWDPVADLGWFGPDPSELPHAVGLPTDGISGHSDYLEPGSTSARSVSSVVVGEPGAAVRTTIDIADVIRLVLGAL